MIDAELQIRMAAKGCISGKLSEWPFLICALAEYGISLPPDTHAFVVKTVCLTILESVGEQYEQETSTRRASAFLSSLRKGMEA